MIHKMLLRLRLRSGLTQEELSELSGVSVRTIRNLERGHTSRPRRSSVDLLLAVMDPERKRDTGSIAARLPTDLSAEWLHADILGTVAWQGPKPPHTSVIGRRLEIGQISQLATTGQIVVICGPGGVGKSRVALAAAESVSHLFANGVAVAEMGRIPAERHDDDATALDMALEVVLDLIPDSMPVESGLLLVLDNTEHLPQTSALLIERLLVQYPGLHILVTSRRPLNLAGARIWELRPLPTDQAIELLIDRLRAACPTLDLSGMEAQLSELCEQLDHLPRLLEFVANRLRTVSLQTLLSDRRALLSLGSTDFGCLPHQRSIGASVGWSLNLLHNDHRDLLIDLAHRSTTIWLETSDIQRAINADGVELLADLADSSLLQVNRGQQYEYRMLRHVQAILAEFATPHEAGLRSVAAD